MQICRDAAPRRSHTLDGRAVFGTQSPQKQLWAKNMGAGNSQVVDGRRESKDLGRLRRARIFTPLTMGGITCDRGQPTARIPAAIQNARPCPTLLSIPASHPVPSSLPAVVMFTRGRLSIPVSQGVLLPARSMAIDTDVCAADRVRTDTRVLDSSTSRVHRAVTCAVHCVFRGPARHEARHTPLTTPCTSKIRGACGCAWAWTGGRPYRSASCFTRSTIHTRLARST